MLAESMPGAMSAFGNVIAAEAFPSASSLVLTSSVVDDSNLDAGSLNVYPSYPLKSGRPGFSVIVILAGSPDAAGPVSQLADIPALVLVPLRKISFPRLTWIFSLLGFMVSMRRALWNVAPPTFTYAFQSPVGLSCPVGMSNV